MKITRLVGMLLIAFAAAGCTSMGLIGQLDPSVTINKSDPIAFVVPENASILNRQFLVEIKQKFEQSGYNVVDTSQATWILLATVETATRYTGAETKGAFIGAPVLGGAVGVGKSKTIAEYSNDITLRLVAYPAKQFQNSQRQAVWQGIVNTTADQFEGEDPDINSAHQEILRALVSIYGKNFYDDSIDLKDFQIKS